MRNLATTATLALVMLLGVGSTAFGQSEHDQHHPEGAPATQGAPLPPGATGGAMGPGTTGQGMGSGMMGQGMGSGMMGQGGMWHTGPHMMSPAEMQEMMAHMGGMMGHGPGMGSGMMGQMGPGMMGPGMMGQTGPGMMGPGMMGQTGPGMMGPGMMGQMPGMMGPGMMGQTGPGMMGPGMMGQTGPGMMGPGMMGQMGPGMMGMQGLRVVPMMHLSTDDVRQFLERHIAAHGLTRLQVGEVTETDDETITADIVTREGSLALRLEIDAYTGFVKSVS